MSESGARTARWLLAVVVFLILYASLFPFRFRDPGITGFTDLLARLSWARTTRSDIAANILLYLPFGACLSWMLVRRAGWAIAIVLAIACAALLSASVEVIQVFESRRVPSLSDLSYNTLGAALGAMLALALQQAGSGLGRHPLDQARAHPIAAALVVLWVGYRLLPFAPALAPSQWLDAVKTLLAEPWWRPWETLRWLVPWLVVGQALTTLSRSGAGLTSLLLVSLLVATGLVILSGKALHPAELTAIVLALVGTWVFARAGGQRVALVLAWGVAVLFVVDGLAPFDFRIDRDAFGWVPFAESLLRYRSTNLPDMFGRCFVYGSLVWLLVRAGRSPLRATMLAVALVLAVEVLQVWLPGKTADITDPLLALAAGGLLALFEGQPRRRIADWPAGARSRG